ncbi:Sugar or nucleoside kinase, ribokinase family [Amycolatopsis arida]|uniref:Sugar or nucleoside kinase, ribokinase family n=1 Tax=Amycolatopsis arida TaxID=587909 RepID=A0A1I5T5T9_9PSEU|nr:PfkB family carbohydrate kinase [Amycolatopsis arida]TDX96219.1 sugar/nucleoside kinase (ribokinase family) [Amycolatopsis arida]SFP78399.1 Sugar or nucleoside kinase, ribokinase family [Amycolatopsis arida]
MSVLLAGLCTVDVVQRVVELPAPGEKAQSTSVAVAAGGPATNAAVTVAALGERARLLTVLGAHPLAGLARADLDACGVTVVDAAPDHPDPPAVSAVAVRERDGERTVVSHNAAAMPAVRVRPDLDGVRAVLVDGHHPDLALAVAEAARASGLPVVLDAGSWKPVLARLLPLVDIAACSAHFTAPDGALDAVPTVITTAGPEPVRWRTATGAGEVPVPAVEARDTLAAGDVWHGALVAGVSRLPVPELIAFANEVAAERVRHVGPRSWIRPVRARMGVR